MSTWTNNDGLVIHFGPTEKNVRPGEVANGSLEREIVVTFDYDNYPTTQAGDTGVLVIPAYSFIISARLHVDVAFTGGGTSGLDIGTNIDADGFIVDSAEGATANLTADSVVEGAGALIGAQTSGTNQYITVASSGGTGYTAGTARLVIKYLQPYNIA